MNPVFSISTDPEQLQLDVIHRFLTTSYWAYGIPLRTVERSIAGSLCFGVFHEQSQIGFARVVTDRATFAYLCDVFIVPEYQGRGLGKRLLAEILAHPNLQGLRRFCLATRDAHGLYAQFGFEPLVAGNFMEVVVPDIYRAHGTPQSD